jgi:hypothetical protein
MKIFRKIRQTLVKEGSVRKYLIYAIGEILLVMIGILLAFQVNSWNTQRIKEKAERISYQNIKRQINDDKLVISGLLDYNNLYLKQYEFATQIIEKNDRSKIDTLGYIALKLIKYSDYNRNSNIYQTLVNSGEMKLLNNDEIKEELQSLEDTYIYINRMEKIHFDVIMFSVISDLQTFIKFSDRTVQEPEQLYTYEFQNKILTFISIMKEKDEIYHRAMDKIKAITELIDKELNFDIEN